MPPGPLVYSFSDCDSQVLDKIQIDNKLPLCHSESAAFVHFMSGLVDDRELGIITRQDRLAVWELYGKNAPGRLVTGAVK